MAGKISDLALLATPDAADYVEVLDVSDLSMAASGTNKRSPVSAFGGGSVEIPRIAGEYYRVALQQGLWGQNTTNESDSTSGRVWLVWLPGQGHSLSAFGVQVTTGGDGTAKLRLAVYSVAAGVAASPTAIVGGLLHDSGQIAADSTGTKMSSGLSIPIPATGLWLAFCGQFSTTAPTVRAVNYNYGPGIEAIPITAATDLRGGALTFSGVSGAYPDPATSVTTSAVSIGWLIPDFMVQYA